MRFQNARDFGFADGRETLGEVALAEGNAEGARRESIEALNLLERFGVQQNTAWCLVVLAGAAALDEDPERGAKLWGAGEATREQIGCRIAPASRANRERTVAMLRKQLGEAEFVRLTAEGAKLTVDAAVELALQAPVTG
jgi:hypothetical protein